MERIKGFIKSAAAPLLFAALIIAPMGTILLFAEYAPWEKPNSITASSEVKDQFRRYHPYHLADGTWASWCEGAAGDGIGSKFTYTYGSAQTVKDVYIKNGFGLRQYFPLNSRVKKIRMTADKKKAVLFDLADKPDVQRFRLKEPVAGEVFVFEILEVYRGSKFSDTCIAELGFKPFTIADAEEMPKFKTFSFGLASSGNMGQAYNRITLKSDGTVKEVNRFGAQCDMPFLGGTWSKKPDGSVIIDYDYKEPINCGDMMNGLQFKDAKESIRLKRFAIDGIIEAGGDRGVDISWD
ncbi:MAG: hypothetical protein KA369_13320 [Spirochaetes bacterium]|nr:hypothetical protein [Spirochaetota bacterium]